MYFMYFICKNTCVSRVILPPHSYLHLPFRRAVAGFAAMKRQAPMPEFVAAP
jgi:hypothetical protein